MFTLKTNNDTKQYQSARAFDPRNNEIQATKEDGNRFGDMGKEFKKSSFEDIEKRTAIYKDMIKFLMTYKGHKYGNYGKFYMNILNSKFENGKIIFEEVK